MKPFLNPIIGKALIGAALILAALAAAAVCFGQTNAGGFYNRPFPFATLMPESDDNIPTLLAKLLAVQQSPTLAATRNAGATHAANGQVTATADGNATLVGRTTRRRSAWVNTSASEVVYFGFAPGVTATTGVPMAPGAAAGMGYTGAVYFFSASGGARLAWFEAYD